MKRATVSFTIAFASFMSHACCKPVVRNSSGGGLLRPLVKFFGPSNGTVSKFPPVLEFVAQKIQAQFSNYVYEDLSRPPPWDSPVYRPSTDEESIEDLATSPPEHTTVLDLIEHGDDDDDAEASTSAKPSRSNGTSDVVDDEHFVLSNGTLYSNNDVGKHKDNVSKETFEDAECGEEWPNTSTIDLYAIASAAGRLAGNLNTRPGALDDFFNKLKVLEHEWYEAEKKYHTLKIENDKLSNQLINERTRCAIYQKKLKFIQDNHKNFERLKQVYLNMKYQEAAGRSMVEIREKASQTQSDPRSDGPSSYHGIISMFGHSESKIAVKMSDLTEAQENLQALKDMVRKREYTWALNKKREDLLRDEIKKLERENEMTSQLVKAKDLEMDAMKVIDENESKRADEEEELKKIVLKMDKRLRELEKVGKIGKYNVIFSDKEKRLIHELCEKDSKLLKKAHSRGIVSAPLFGARAPMNRTASSPVSKTSRLPLKVNTSAMVERKATDKRPQHVTDGLNEIRELEILAKIRRGIEKKQAALKEKVQDLIDYTDIPAACPISTHH